MQRKSVRYNYIILTVLLLLSTASIPAKDKPLDEVPVENYIAIQGSSNISEFKLFNYNPIVNKIASDAHVEGRYRKLKIRVDEFTTGNERMLHDFRKMLKSSEYPYIGIAIERRDLAQFDETSGLSVFNIIITITGISHKYNVPCDVRANVDYGYILQGNFQIKLSDFKIKPPEKVFGLVKVKNTVFINFALRFKSEETLTEKI